MSNIKQNYFKFEGYSHPFFYTPVTKSTEIKYDEEHVIGHWYQKSRFNKLCLMYVPKESFLKSGERLLNKLKNGNQDFQNRLFNICKKIINLSEFLSDFSYQVYKENKEIELADFYNRYENIFSEAMAFGY